MIFSALSADVGRDEVEPHLTVCNVDAYMEVSSSGESCECLSEMESRRVK